jgi:hypothetical protein
MQLATELRKAIQAQIALPPFWQDDMLFLESTELVKLLRGLEKLDDK